MLYFVCFVILNFVLVKWDVMKLFLLYELFCLLMEEILVCIYDMCMDFLCKMVNKFRMKLIISMVCDLYVVNIYFIKFI